MTARVLRQSGPHPRRPPASPERGLHRLRRDSDVVELSSVGIDVGSATFHLTVSRIVLERRVQALSTRYDVVAREAVFASPVMFTPYLASGDIDAAAVDAAVRRAFAEGGVEPEDIDSGVVLLTGAALLRRNAQALAERLAGTSGTFVCAAAGHHFEAALAAHGSGAVTRSRESQDPVVALDVGGATTKFALVVGGDVRATAAVAAGSRLLAWDRERRLVRVEQAVVPLARSVGLPVELGRAVEPAALDALCDRMALSIVAQLDPAHASAGVTAAPLLTDPFPAPRVPFEIVASGGVAEYLGGRERAAGHPGGSGGSDGPGGSDHPDHPGHPGDPDHPGDSDHAGDPGDPDDPGDPGDLGPRLARALRARLRAAGLESRLRTGGQRIRATVIGASQFATQVSGSTISVDAAALPVHHVPVVRLPVDLGAAERVDSGAVASALTDAVRRRFSEQAVPGTVAVSLRWRGEPAHARLRAVAEGLVDGQRAAGVACVLVAVDADIASSLGRIMHTELGAGRGTAICLDNLDLADFDYVDVGRPVEPAKVVPVVVKSLVFGAGEPSATRTDPSSPRGRTQGEPT